MVRFLLVLLVFHNICDELFLISAAMEVLSMVGFCEDVVFDEVGRVETYMVLKRNDPGLLWLAKSSLEMSIA